MFAEYSLGHPAPDRPPARPASREVNPSEAHVSEVNPMGYLLRIYAKGTEDIRPKTQEIEWRPQENRCAGSKKRSDAAGLSGGGDGLGERIAAWLF